MYNIPSYIFLSKSRRYFLISQSIQQSLSFCIDVASCDIHKQLRVSQHGDVQTFDVTNVSQCVITSVLGSEDTVLYLPFSHCINNNEIKTNCGWQRTYDQGRGLGLILFQSFMYDREKCKNLSWKTFFLLSPYNMIVLSYFRKGVLLLYSHTGKNFCWNLNFVVLLSI